MAVTGGMAGCYEGPRDLFMLPRLCLNDYKKQSHKAKGIDFQ